jgi:uncharacterized protein (TIGR00255 family)
MMKSMTGYGRGEYAGSTGSYFVEVSSINHRFLEVKARLPRGWNSYESRVQKEISRRFKRGHFDVYLTEKDRGEKQGGLTLDLSLAEQYFQSLKALKKDLHLPGRIDIQLIGGVKEVLSWEEPRASEECWEDMQRALVQALDALDDMRQREGLALETQIKEGMEQVKGLLDSIMSRWPEAREEHRKRIIERIGEMLQGKEMDQIRMEQELALWAERWDITEECVRLQSHIQQGRTLHSQDSPSGRPLDFLLQEMHREANTISAKASDARISHQIIRLKTEIERLREQAQNVE